MDPNQVPICIWNENEKKQMDIKSLPKEYNTIQNFLNKIDNKKWLLIERSGEIISDNNLNIFKSPNLIAITFKDIPKIYQRSLKTKELKKNYNIMKEECNEYKKKASEQQKIVKAVPAQVGIINELQDENMKLEAEIKKLQEKVQEKSEKLDNQKKDSKKVLDYNSEYINDLEQKSQEVKSLSNENQKLQTLNQEFSKQLEISKELEQKCKEKITNLETYSLGLEKKLNESEADLQKLKSQQVDTQTQSKMCYQIIDFYTDSNDAKNQDGIKQIFSKQINFLDSMIQKLCDDKKRLEEIKTRGEKNQAIIYQTRLDVYLIELDDQKFLESFQVKNFFFRNNCIIKKKVSSIQQQQIINNNQQIQIRTIDQQSIDINQMYKIYESEYQALDIIFNILLFEKYLYFFQDDLNKTIDQNEKYEQVNLKIPKQFLIKDNANNYYIYQECLGNNIKKFKPFQNTSKVDQYISCFFKYIYISTNENLAITECELAVQNNKNEKVEVGIQNIIIHSKYAKGFSQLDKGIDEIQEFKNLLSQVPPGAIQQYWSEQLEHLAQKLWNEQLQ